MTWRLVRGGNAWLFGRQPWSVLLLTGAILAIGVAFIGSASYDVATGAPGGHAEKQLVWIAAGAVAFLVMQAIPYERVARNGYAVYAVALVLLALVLVLGTRTMGARRWFAFGSIRFQPSELAKLAVVIALARYLRHREEAIRTWGGLAGACALVAAPILLILEEPDLGTSLAILPAAAALVFVAGARIAHIALLGLAAVLTAPLAWLFVLHDYQKVRVLAFLDPESRSLSSAYQTIQSEIALGAGGLTGRGLGQGTQNQLGFLPIRHTDFIFAVIGEEWGLAGTLGMIALFALLFLALLGIARATREPFGRLVATGIAVQLAAQVAINVGVVTGALPCTGLTLPLVSYGGSSILFTLAGLGLAASVHRHGHRMPHLSGPRRREALALG